MEYYLKEILANPVTIQGRTAKFENIGANRGVLAIDPAVPENKALCDKLAELASKGLGGVSKISEADYTQKKSTAVLTPSGRPREMLRPRLSPVPPVQSPAKPAAAAAPAAVNPVPAPAPAPAPAAPEAEFDPANMKSVNSEPATPSFQPPTKRVGRPPKNATAPLP